MARCSGSGREPGVLPAWLRAGDRQAKKPKARKLRVATQAPGVELLHRSLYLPGTNAANVPELIASPLPVRDLPIALAPAAVAIDKKKRGLLLPFEIGGDLRDDTAVEYSAIALDPEGKVVSRANGRGRARNGRVVGDIGLDGRVEDVSSEQYGLLCLLLRSGLVLLST